MTPQPPIPILVGIGHVSLVNQQKQPIVVSFFPQMMNSGLCMKCSSKRKDGTGA
jgi:peroxiredoxin